MANEDVTNETCMTKDAMPQDRLDDARADVEVLRLKVESEHAARYVMERRLHAQHREVLWCRRRIAELEKRVNEFKDAQGTYAGEVDALRIRAKIAEKIIDQMSKGRYVVKAVTTDENPAKKPAKKNPRS